MNTFGTSGEVLIVTEFPGITLRSIIKILKATSFIGINKLRLHWRGGHKRSAVSKLEMSCICRVKCLRPLGLNADVEINAFIDNS